MLGAQSANASRGTLPYHMFNVNDIPSSAIDMLDIQLMAHPTPIRHSLGEN
jgi:hypothetical protein